MRGSLDGYKVGIDDGWEEGDVGEVEGCVDGVFDGLLVGLFDGSLVG